MNKVEELQKSRLFEGLLPEEIEMLAEVTQHKKFSQEEVVFEQGDVGDSLYLRVEGTVDVVQKRKDGSELTLPDNDVAVGPDDLLSFCSGKMCDYQKKRLFRCHFPDTHPIIRRRILFHIFTTFNIHLGQFVTGIQF